MQNGKNRSASLRKPTASGKAIEARQRERQISQQLSLIIEIIQRPRDGCECSGHASLPVMALDTPRKDDDGGVESLRAELGEVREVLTEVQEIVKRSTGNRVGESFIKEYARMMGRVTGLPSGPKTKTQEEIAALTEEMGRLLEDYGFTPIVPVKGDAFDPSLHVPIEVNGSPEGGGERLIERLYRPGVSDLNGRVVLHARVGLFVKSKPRKKEK